MYALRYRESYGADGKVNRQMLWEFHFTFMSPKSWTRENGWQLQPKSNKAKHICYNFSMDIFPQIGEGITWMYLYLPFIILGELVYRGNFTIKKLFQYLLSF